MKVLLLLIKGFETMEFSPFVDIIGWARTDCLYDVSFEMCGLTKEVTSSFGVKVTVDKLIDAVRINEYDALVIPGGFEEYGFYDEAYNEKVLELIRDFNRLHKIIASVCVGALPIAKSGILVGRNGTTYHLKEGYRQEQMEEMGVNIINDAIVVDDNIITSYCPQTAPYVAFTLMELLIGKERIDKVRTLMGF